MWISSGVGHYVKLKRFARICWTRQSQSFSDSRSREIIADSFKQSLTRLGTTIDLHELHEEATF